METDLFNFAVVLKEKCKWANGGFSGPPTGYNVRLASGGELVQFIVKLEQLLMANGLDVKQRTKGQHCYLPIRGNAHQTETM